MVRARQFNASNKPSPVLMAGVRNKPDYGSLEMRRFCARQHILYHLFYHLPKPFPLDSRPFLAGTVVAERGGVGAA